MEKSYQHVKSMGFSPSTVIDVGIAKGTPELYSVFPDAYYLLVEPLQEFERTMKNILQYNKGEYLLKAAGNKNQNVDFYVHLNHLSGSSVLQETMGKEADGIKRTVEMIRLDDYVITNKLKGLFLIKIDVQGAEIRVLEGCKNILEDTEVIILEVSLFQFMKGAPELYDIIDYMKNIGYVTYDIELAWNRPLDNALGQINILFVKESGMFRKNHSYASVNQLNKVFG